MNDYGPEARAILEVARRADDPSEQQEEHKVAAVSPTPEKKDLKIGFIAITCASPLIMADPLGFYAKEGLNVALIKTAVGK